MAEHEDLMSKADALMARHRPARTDAEPYAEIPVLNEVVDIAPEHGEPPLLTELAAPAPLDKEQIEALAAGIRASLLAALQPSVDTLIENCIQEGLAPRVERLFADLRSDLQPIARQILGEAIHTAVERELERRRSDG